MSLAFGEGVAYGLVGGASLADCGKTADFFSILLRQRLPMLLDQRLLMLHGWLERGGWIYCIRKGAGSSILAFEFF